MWNYIITPICYVNREITYFIKKNEIISNFNQYVVTEIYTLGKDVFNIMSAIQM
jgi:hypothetical protein